MTSKKVYVRFRMRKWKSPLETRHGHVMIQNPCEVVIQACSESTSKSSISRDEISIEKSSGAAPDGQVGTLNVSMMVSIVVCSWDMRSWGRVWSRGSDDEGRREIRLSEGSQLVALELKGWRTESIFPEGLANTNLFIQLQFEFPSTSTMAMRLANKCLDAPLDIVHNNR